MVRRFVVVTVSFRVKFAKFYRMCLFQMSKALFTALFFDEKCVFVYPIPVPVRYEFSPEFSSACLRYVCRMAYVLFQEILHFVSALSLFVIHMLPPCLMWFSHLISIRPRDYGNGEMTHPTFVIRRRSTQRFRAVVVLKSYVKPLCVFSPSSESRFLINARVWQWAVHSPRLKQRKTTSTTALAINVDEDLCGNTVWMTSSNTNWVIR